MSEHGRSRGSAPGPAEATWATLERVGADATPTFDPSSLVGLPEPAQRFLCAAIPAEAPLARAVVLEMVGRIRLVGRWLPFTARQILCAGVGFVWRPEVGGRVAALRRCRRARTRRGPNGVPTPRPAFPSSGPTDRTSPAAPQDASPRKPSSGSRRASPPRPGANWRPVDDDRAVVAVPVPDGTIDVEVTVDQTVAAENSASNAGTARRSRRHSNRSVAR